jgi:hypothetical protein
MIRTRKKLKDFPDITECDIILTPKIEEATHEARVKCYLNEFKFRFFRNPTANEVATEIGEHPTIVKEYYIKLHQLLNGSRQQVKKPI